MKPTTSTQVDTYIHGYGMLANTNRQSKFDINSIRPYTNTFAYALYNSPCNVLTTPSNTPMKALTCHQFVVFLFAFVNVSFVFYSATYSLDKRQTLVAQTIWTLWKNFSKKIFYRFLLNLTILNIQLTNILKNISVFQAIQTI